MMFNIEWRRGWGDDAEGDEDGESGEKRRKMKRDDLVAREIHRVRGHSTRHDRSDTAVRSATK